MVFFLILFLVINKICVEVKFDSILYVLSLWNILIFVLDIFICNFLIENWMWDRI